MFALLVVLEAGVFYAMQSCCFLGMYSKRAELLWAVMGLVCMTSLHALLINENMSKLCGSHWITFSLHRWIYSVIHSQSMSDATGQAGSIHVCRCVSKLCKDACVWLLVKSSAACHHKHASTFIYNKIAV